MNYKDIKIGRLIKDLVDEAKINSEDLCTYFKISETELNKIYSSPSLNSEDLLQWSIFLKYDFFRIYSQHLILYAPPADTRYTRKGSEHKKKFKNIYTKEIIEFILEQIKSGEKTDIQVVEDYRIPKNTLYKWKKKYNQ
ncbi:hypothetical protein AU378_10110 [Chryseobacterium kwangjuense]|uniref:Uncharacterized protein n=1 Tax=Chryseobacterium kwangjuense TaxID=267125 RepID=A0A135WFF5_9FLAO|nr:hypothetical protein AU378_10110 [Chryseobacterium kwangjuense]